MNFVNSGGLPPPEQPGSNPPSEVPAEHATNKVVDPLAHPLFNNVREFLKTPLSLPELTEEQILETLKAFKEREEQLQREIVYDDGFVPFGATRSLADWQNEMKAFREKKMEAFGAIQKIAATRLAELAEAQGLNIEKPASSASTINSADIPALDENEAAFQNYVVDAVTKNDAAVLRLMALHVPSQFHDFLFSEDPTFRAMTIQEWNFPFDDPKMVRRFIQAVTLEQANEGSGIAHLKGELPRERSVIMRSCSAIAGAIKRLYHAAMKDRF